MVYAVNILPFGRHLNDSVYPLFLQKAYKTVCFNNKAQFKTVQMLYVERFSRQKRKLGNCSELRGSKNSTKVVHFIFMLSPIISFFGGGLFEF